MKIAVIVSLVASVVSAVHGLAINSQKNGAFISASASTLAIHPTQAPASAHGTLPAVRNPSDAIPDRSPTKLAKQDNNYGDLSANLLGQLLTPLKTILTRILTDAETRLEQTDVSKLSDVLRGPVGDLKNHLISIWPNTPPLKPATALPPSKN